MNSEVPQKQMFAVEVPAIVNNDGKLLDMLGGLDEVLRVFDSEKLRLRLRFRPKMIFAKPACGDPSQVTGLVLSVKQYKNRLTGETKLVPTVIARVPRMYTFETMVDFQYGPYERVNNETPPPPSTLKGDDKYRVFYDDLIIKVPTTTLDSFLSKNTPLFLPPIQFSRQDLPFNYNFAPRHRSSEYIELEEKCHILPVIRKPRHNFGRVISFEDPTPEAPHPQAVERLMAHYPDQHKVLFELDKLFKGRPIWLRNAIAKSVTTNLRSALYKGAIICFAYYMVRGPWSRSWIRYGYDPRTDPEARFYQVIDFRIKSHVLIRQILERNIRYSSMSSNKTRRGRLNWRRPDGSLHWLSDAPQTQTKNQSSTSLKSDAEVDMEGDLEMDYANEMAEDAVDVESGSLHVGYSFSRDHLPTAQQMLICLSDIDIPEVQAIVAEKPERTVCDPVDGWLNPGRPARIRELMTEHLQLWLSEEEPEIKY